MSAPGRAERTLALLLAAGALACAGSRPAPGGLAADAGAVPDGALGLVKGSVFDLPAPPPVPVNSAAPGQGLPAARSYPGAPPPISHAVPDGLAVTLTANSCLGCHGAKGKEPGKATPVPSSHYVDLRRGRDGPGDEVAGARRVCTACHVESTGAPPLVRNRFRSR